MNSVGLVLVCLFGASLINAEHECRTPYDHMGYCVPILQCGSLMRLLRTAKSNPSNRDYLRNSHCGNVTLVAKNVHVCCPLYDPDTLTAFDGCDVHNNRYHRDDNSSFIDEFPWTAKLMYSVSATKKSSLCSGALINNEYVLTAAHCVHEKRLRKRGIRLDSIRFGEWNTSSEVDCLQTSDCADPVFDAEIGSIIVHENYTVKENSLDDIALVRLKKRVPKYTDFIKPICITDDIYSVVYRSPFYTVNGWGYKEKGVDSDVMLSGKLRSEITLCEQTYGKMNISINSTKQICAGGEDLFDTCYGNGGAPLMQVDENTNNWILQGILSFGPEICNGTGTPAVYTRIREYHFWILDKMLKGVTFRR